ncbi:MAG: GAF domain-containing SpoIIE family protein phosphatase [Ilumatobacteraceae bacterium]
MSQNEARLEALRRSGMLGRRTFAEFDRLTQLASVLIGAPVSLVSMIDEDRQYFTSHFGLSDELSRARETPIAQSVCATVVELDAPLVIDALIADPKWIDHPARTEIDVAAYCGVPIRDRDGNVLGSFCVIDDEVREWGATDIEILERFAEIVGDYMQTSNDHHALIVDLQHRLLPTSRPTLTWGSLQATYRPVPGTGIIGGDFYDWIVNADSSIDVIVGDVVGHGVGSTQAAAQLRAAYRAVLTDPTVELPDVVTRISAACAGLPDCACAALLVARIDGDGVVDFVRAGATPPITVDAAGASVHGAKGGPPLGTGPWTTEHLSRIQLHDGDTLLLYTDGLVERRGEVLDDGFARACAHAKTFSSLDEFIDGACPSFEQLDDLAVVALTRRSST